MLPAIYHDIILEFLKNKKLTAVFLMYFVAVMLLFVQVTHAVFSASASSINNSFAAASTFPSPTPTPIPGRDQLVINEVFNAASPAAEWVELYNGTNNPIDLTGDTIGDNTSDDIIPSTPPLPPGGYAVIITHNSVVTVPDSTIEIRLDDNQIGGGLSQTGDKVALLESGGAELDVMNWGTNHDSLDPSVPAPGSGQSMARIPDGYDAGEASDFQLDDTPTVGTENSL
jgi:hypothetical protein